MRASSCVLSGNGERVLDQDGTTAPSTTRQPVPAAAGQDVAVAGAYRGARSVVARSGDLSIAEQSTPTISWRATPGPFWPSRSATMERSLASVNPQGVVTTSVAGDEVPVPCTQSSPGPRSGAGPTRTSSLRCGRNEAAVYWPSGNGTAACAPGPDRNISSSDSGSTVLDVKADGTTV